MFWKKKNTIDNKTFGEMKYWTIEWRSTYKTKMTLWNKEHHIELACRAVSEEGITENQEKAYQYFKETIIDRQKEIEDIIANHYKIYDQQILNTKFTPTRLLFSISGACGLFFDDNDEGYGPNDDHDVGFTVSILPELKIYSQEEYDGYVFGGGGL